MVAEKEELEVWASMPFRMENVKESTLLPLVKGGGISGKPSLGVGSRR